MTFSGLPLNFCRERLVLGADADRAGVGVALPHHDAAHGDQRRRADAELLGAEHGGDHHVAAGLDAAVGPQLHPVPQAVQQQHLVRSLRPISQGRPAYLMEETGEAPVPPEWPDTRIASALALATPAAMVPMPERATSFTQTVASGLICFRS
jgi:hypothetical protein